MLWIQLAFRRLDCLIRYTLLLLTILMIEDTPSSALPAKHLQGSTLVFDGYKYIEPATAVHELDKLLQPQSIVQDVWKRCINHRSGIHWMVSNSLRRKIKWAWACTCGNGHCATQSGRHLRFDLTPVLVMLPRSDLSAGTSWNSLSRKDIMSPASFGGKSMPKALKPLAGRPSWETSTTAS